MPPTATQHEKKTRTKRGAVLTTRSPDKIKAGYDVTTWRGNGKRRAGGIESLSEIGVFNILSRLKGINLMREIMRNLPQARIFAQQLRVNVVGTEGGKLFSTTDVEEWDDAVGTFWTQYIESVDYRDGKGLNELLKLILCELAVGGGDFVIMFDDGILETTVNRGFGSGKVLPFESDNIGDMEPEEFQKRFPGHIQAQGIIYNKNGRMVGVVVSPKKRGLTSFSKSDCFALTRNPDAAWTESSWYYGKRTWRLVQERGISPQIVAAAMLIDLYEVQAAETQTAKVAAQTLAQIVDKIGDTPEEYDNDGLESDIKKECAGTEGAEGGQDTEAEGTEKQEEGYKFDDELFHEATSGGRVLKMLAGTELKLLEAKRPNPEIKSYIDWLLRTAGGAHGLTSIYSTLKAEASYTAFRGEQSMAMPTFEEAQKELERGPLTFIAVKAIQWGIDTGLLPKNPPKGWQHALAWDWPTQREVNEVDAQRALALKYQNKDITMLDRWGPGYKKIIKQLDKEAKLFGETESKLVHPSQLTANGMPQATPGGGNPETEDGK